MTWLYLVLAAAALAACSSSDDAAPAGGGDTDVSDVDASDTEGSGDDTGDDSASDVPVLDVDLDTDTDTEDTAAAEDAPGVPPETIIIDGAAELPAAFATASAGSAAGPRMAYPADGTLMPRNTAAPVIQWQGPNGGRYRLTVRTTAREHHVFTTSWSWEPDAGVWGRFVAEAGADPVEIEVSSLEPAGEVLTGEPVTVQFSAANVQGAVYYWAPTANGIVRLPLGDPVPEIFLTGSVFNCVGCHALSPDGSRLAYTRSSGGTPIGTLGVIGTDEFRTQYVDEGALGLYYPSFAPDNVNLAASRGGEIVVLNTDTGEVTDVLDRPEGTSANFPAWSPRGDVVTFSAGASSGGGISDSLGATSAGLARVRRGRDGEWGAAEWLIENGDAGGSPENLFYPAYSPDGRWIVFNRARSTTAVGGSPDGAELWVISAEGTSAVPLDAANGVEGTTNSWPKWAPASDDGTLWIAFTSMRPYGRLGGDKPQIWIAGLTPGRALPGFDPSWSAFWLPGQSLADSNHVAYWAEFEKD